MSYNGSFSVEKIRLTDIKVKKAEIDNPNELSSVMGESYSRTMKFNFQFAADLNTSQAKAYFTLNLNARKIEDSSSDIVLGYFEFVYTFFVQDLIDFITKNQKSIIIDTQLGISMANIAYSTSRGIIFTRCSGTVFDGAIMPILSNSIIEKIVRQQENIVEFE